MFASKDFFQATTAPSGYQLTRSLRFRASASAYLNRTFGTPTNQAKWTYSCWVKKSAIAAAGASCVISAGTGASDTTRFDCLFYTGDQILLQGGTTVFRQTTQVFRDPSSFYHFVIAVDTTQATESLKLRVYINNSEVSWTTTNAITTCGLNSAQTVCIARTGSGVAFFDGYFAEAVFVDGQQLTPSSFGQTDSATGVWVPKKYSGTYGNNGFYLPLTDTSSTTNLVKDSSGNGNNWTPNNISLTAGTTYDSMIDVPYCTGQINGTQPSGNYCVMNRLDCGSALLTNGNLKFDNNGSYLNFARANFGVSSGKWYWEYKTTTASANNYALNGITTASVALGTDVTVASTSYGYYARNGNKYAAGTGSAYGTAYDSSNVIGVALDLSGNTITFYRDNVSQGAISIAANTYFPYATDQSTTDYSNFNFGQQPFVYTPPSGFKALCAPNLAAPTIANGAGYMAATTYTGTGASLSVTNTVGSKSFQPDLVWIKSRSAATNNNLFDSIRGTTNYLISNSTAANASNANTLTAFNSNGFTVGTDASSIGVNVNTATYVGWQWLAGAGTTSSNTNGSITSTVCVNTTSGFSVVTYTGTGVAGTVGHGLGVTPQMIIIKDRSSVTSWPVQHISLGTMASKYLVLNTTAASVTDTSIFNNTAPTSTVFSIGNSANTWVNTTSDNYVAYCFASIAGYSAFGSYTGNGSTDGPFVYCGFRPKFVLTKMSSAAGGSWVIQDDVRTATYNPADGRLVAESNAAEDISGIDLLANGFKIRNTSVSQNNDTNTRIYAAFAENPFNYSLAR